MQRVSFLLEMVVLKEGRDRNGLNSLVAACLAGKPRLRLARWLLAWLAVWQEP